MRKNVQPFAGEYGADGPPPEKGKQVANHLPANTQMAANGIALMVSWKLFTKKSTPSPLQRTESPQFFHRLQAFLLSRDSKLFFFFRDSKLFHVFRTCSKFSSFSFVFKGFFFHMFLMFS